MFSTGVTPSTYERMNTMLDLILYCDLSTMDNCTEDTINEILSKISVTYRQISNSLWYFKYRKFDGSPLHKEENIVYDNFDKYLNENSILFLTKFTHHDCYYHIPSDESLPLED